MAVALALAVGLAVEEGWADGSVPWQAARARQPRMRAQRNEKRDMEGVKLARVRGLAKEWLEMGSPP
jgi:hypothetical protein